MVRPDRDEHAGAAPASLPGARAGDVPETADAELVGPLVTGARQDRWLARRAVDSPKHARQSKSVRARSSRRFDNDVWNVLFAQHGVESRHIFRHELLKLFLVFIALLFQQLLDGLLLGGVREIGAPADLGSQIADFLEQHRRASCTVLASSR